MNTSQVVIGLDCGASHTKIKIWKLNEKIFEKDDWPGMNMDLIKDGIILDKFRSKLHEVVDFDNGLWVIALAGVDSKSEEQEADRWWRKFLTSEGVKFSEVKILSDIDLVIWSGSDKGIGIGLIAGTGSNCLGIDDARNRVKVGGMSHLLSDEGSGFAIGWRGLRLITKMNDGRSPKTKLIKDALELYKVKNVVDLKNLLLESEDIKYDVARLTPVLFAAAEENDQEAMEIIDGEINELVLMVATENRQLSPVKQHSVYLAGSLFKNEYFYNKFMENLHLSYPDQKIERVNPIDGVINYIEANF